MTSSHRAIIVAALMATYLQAVSITLPNAAAPYMQGSLSMSLDEVGWIFTSYLTGGILVTPMTRWLAGRYGRKLVYQVSLALFSVGLVLDTQAATATQFVLARVLHGAAGGTLAPL